LIKRAIRRRRGESIRIEPIKISCRELPQLGKRRQLRDIGDTPYPGLDRQFSEVRELRQRREIDHAKSVQAQNAQTVDAAGQSTEAVTFEDQSKRFGQVATFNRDEISRAVEDDDSRRARQSNGDRLSDLRKPQHLDGLRAQIDHVDCRGGPSDVADSRTCCEPPDKSAIFSAIFQVRQAW
jgi:hypothetical protein